jgi:hypothetical protein
VAEKWGGGLLEGQLEGNGWISGSGERVCEVGNNCPHSVDGEEVAHSVLGRDGEGVGGRVVFGGAVSEVSRCSEERALASWGNPVVLCSISNEAMAFMRNSRLVSKKGWAAVHEAFDAVCNSSLVPYSDTTGDGAETSEGVESHGRFLFH